MSLLKVPKSRPSPASSPMHSPRTSKGSRRGSRNSRPRSVQTKSVAVPKVLSTKEVPRLDDGEEGDFLTMSDEVFQIRKGIAAQLEALLLAKENHAVLGLLLHQYLHVQRHTDEQQYFFCKGVVEMLLHNKLLVEILSVVLERELEVTKDRNTLFRSKSTFTMILGDLLQRPQVSRFGHEVLGAIIKKAGKAKKIDINNDKHGKEHARMTIGLSRALIDSILRSLNKLPPTLRKVLQRMRAVVAKKFPGASQTICGNVFLLRYINPALAQPLKFGLMDKEPSADLRVNLLMISKVMQRAVNGTKFCGVNAPTAMLNDFLGDVAGDMALLHSNLARVTMHELVHSDTVMDFRSDRAASPLSLDVGEPKSPSKQHGAAARDSGERPSLIASIDLSGLNITPPSAESALLSSRQQLRQEGATEAQSQELRVIVLSCILKISLPQQTGSDEALVQRWTSIRAQCTGIKF